MNMKKIISLVVLMFMIAPVQSSFAQSLSELRQRSTFNISQSELKNDAQPPLPGTQDPIGTVSDNRRKSPALAILYSFLLPGMGELYAESYGSGKYFTMADGALWSIFAGFELYGKWKADDYKSFAQSNAGVNLDGKDATFLANIGIYMSSAEYNTQMDLQGNYNSLYNGSKYYWNWNSNDQRKEYRALWTSSENAYNNVRFVVGALILNRIISAINAVRSVSAYNKNLPVETSWNVSVGVDNHPFLPTTITFNFVKSF